MCGRYYHPDSAAIERHWHIGRSNSNPFPERYNVSPTMSVPIIRRADESGELELTTARWSFVPHWWRQSKPPVLSINARSEEAAIKPMWRDAYRSGRWHVAIPALAWYEWQPKEVTDPHSGEVKTIKQPFLIRRANGEQFCFAGLMSYWQAPNAELPQLTAAILTKSAAPSTATVHDRMPVVLPDVLLPQWLDPERQGASAASEIIAQADSDFVFHTVSVAVNNARNESSELTRPMA